MVSFQYNLQDQHLIELNFAGKGKCTVCAKLHINIKYIKNKNLA